MGLRIRLLLNCEKLVYLGLFAIRALWPSQPRSIPLVFKAEFNHDRVDPVLLVIVGGGHVVTKLPVMLKSGR